MICSCGHTFDVEDATSLTHRLKIGDSTKADDVGDLMRGETADLIATSPPYPGNTIWKDIWPDKTIAECHDWLGEVWANCYVVSADRAALIINTADTAANEWNDLHTQRTAEPWKLVRRAIWHKTGFVPCGQSNLLALNHEWVLWFSKGEPWTNVEYVRGGGHPLSATVFAVPFDTERLHKTPYPVELPSRWINIWSVSAMVVLDVFAGSGTTAVACEQLGRECRMMEIDPSYSAVALERMTNLGCTAELAT